MVTFPSQEKPSAFSLQRVLKASYLATISHQGNGPTNLTAVIPKCSLCLSLNFWDHFSVLFSLPLLYIHIYIYIYIKLFIKPFIYKYLCKYFIFCLKVVRLKHIYIYTHTHTHMSKRKCCIKPLCFETVIYKDFIFENS